MEFGNHSFSETCCRSTTSGKKCAYFLFASVAVIGATLASVFAILNGQAKNMSDSHRWEEESFVAGRCFRLCEPRDLLARDDKLMKPVVVHDGIKPTRYFLYLFPPEPTFDSEDVGEPAFLTPYIKSNKISEGRERAEVKYLFGKEKNKSNEELFQIQSYAGYLTVSEKYNSNLYFWFFPSQSNQSNDPIILWLQGGPGATSLFGLFKENGPIQAFVDPKTGLPSAKKNPYSWNRNASVLYIDNPVGAGFSFTENLKGYPNFVNQSSAHLFEALQQFFTLFYEYKDRGFYIMGESYAGKYVPALSHRIHLSLKAPVEEREEIKINLKGIAIGNGWMSPLEQGKYASYLFYHGFLDGKQYIELRELEDILLKKIENREWLDSWMASDQQLHFILQSLNYSSLYDLTSGQFTPDTMNFWYFMQQPHVRKAMNIGNRSMSDGLEIYKAMIEDTMQSIRPELAEALNNYKVLIYHGSLDIICHFPGAQEMLTRTNWTRKLEYHQSQRRSLWLYNEETSQKELAGYVKGDGNLKMVLLRNAGHSAPMDQPQWALRMIEQFINGNLDGESG